jgi:Lrp/AsnC family transcriptional regulator for asnA, asnC and gidA
LKRCPLLDEIDLKILAMLESDGRRSFTEIAENLRVSESCVRKRVLALQRDGVIRRFTVKVDAAKLGYNTVAIVGVDADPTRLLQVAQRLCDFEDVRCVATSTGDHMVMLEIWMKNGRELTKLITDSISTIEGVKRICPALILERLKE